MGFWRSNHERDHAPGARLHYLGRLHREPHRQWTGGSDALTRTNYITVESGAEYTARVITYTYDPLSRLTGAFYSTGEQFEYAYDGVGNRTAYTVTLGSTTVTTYTYDAANRLTSVGDVAYTWDTRGNLTPTTKELVR